MTEPDDDDCTDCEDCETEANIDWKTCKHSWTRLEMFYEPFSHVAYGCRQTCKICGARRIESWCGEHRGGDGFQIYPPKEES